jgi:hypothetical protein
MREAVAQCRLSRDQDAEPWERINQIRYLFVRPSIHPSHQAAIGRKLFVLGCDTQSMADCGSCLVALYDRAGGVEARQATVISATSRRMNSTRGARKLRQAVIEDTAELIK